MVLLSSEKKDSSTEKREEAPRVPRTSSFIAPRVPSANSYYGKIFLQDRGQYNNKKRPVIFWKDQARLTLFPRICTKPFIRGPTAKNRCVLPGGWLRLLAGQDWILLSCPSGFLIVLSVMNTKEQLAQIFFNILEKQSFEHWHSNHFQDYITGEENAPSKAEILKELEWQVSRELNLRWAVQPKPLHSYTWSIKQL